MIEASLFYVFAIILILSAVGIISARNPISCILLLVLAFFNSAGLFLLLGAEFLGLFMVMAYMGAVAVMFLFVLMTINIDFAMLKSGGTGYKPLGIVVGLVMLGELIFAISMGFPEGSLVAVKTVMPMVAETSNIVALGHILFTSYVLPFQVAGLILLVAMVGAIILTHRKRSGVKRQNIGKQIDRKREDSIEIVKVPFGKGLADNED